MTHEYFKFKNTNIPYAKVGRHVFRSLFDAETFCTEHGLDANKVIEYRNEPEFKGKVITIAQYQKAILEEALCKLNFKADAIKSEIGYCNAELKACHPLDRETWEDRQNEAIGKHIGLMEAYELLHELKINLEWLTGWHE